MAAFFAEYRAPCRNGVGVERTATLNGIIYNGARHSLAQHFLVLPALKGNMEAAIVYGSRKRRPGRTSVDIRKRRGYGLSTHNGALDKSVNCRLAGERALEDRIPIVETPTNTFRVEVETLGSCGHNVQEAAAEYDESEVAKTGRGFSPRALL